VSEETVCEHTDPQKTMLYQG